MADAGLEEAEETEEERAEEGREIVEGGLELIGLLVLVSEVKGEDEDAVEEAVVALALFVLFALTGEGDEGRRILF